MVELEEHVGCDVALWKMLSLCACMEELWQCMMLMSVVELEDHVGRDVVLWEMLSLCVCMEELLGQCLVFDVDGLWQN